MFLGGDPSYQQKDKKLIEALGLNLKHVIAGAEAAQVARWSQLYKQRKPVLLYWYDPQYLNLQKDHYLTRSSCRTCSRGACTTRRRAGTQNSIACDYAPYVLDKLMSEQVRDEWVARG